MKRATVVLLCSIVLSFFVGDIIGLSGKVCTYHVSRRNSTYLTYRESYKDCGWFRCSTKHRTNWRVEWFTEWTPQEICCPGYEDVHNVCTPICLEHCQHGHCISPYTCKCDPGFEKNQTFSSICDPVCTEQCINGYCSSPGTCTCYEGFKRNDKLPNICEPVSTEKNDTLSTPSPLREI